MDSIERMVCRVMGFVFTLSPLLLPAAFIGLRLRGTYNFTQDSLVAVLLFLVCVPVSVVSMIWTYRASLWGKG